MNYDINSYFTFEPLKNGRVKIIHMIDHQENVFELLYELGFRKTKLDNKQVYYRRIDAIINPSSLFEIRDTFRSFLKQLEFTNIPKGITPAVISSWCSQNQPIKNNELFDHYLNEELSMEEAHNWKMQLDVNYKHTYEINQMLSKLDEWGFSKTIDECGAIFINAHLYYKNVGKNNFLIFSHYNWNRKGVDGFNCCVATFKNKSLIGKAPSLGLRSIKDGFSISRDFYLISDFLKND